MERSKASRVLAVGRGGCIPPHTLSGLGLGGSERVSSETLAPGGPEGRWGIELWSSDGAPSGPPRVVLFLALCFLEICVHKTNLSKVGPWSLVTSDLHLGYITLPQPPTLVRHEAKG